MAFHEKAGRSQVGSFVFSLDKVFSCPIATVATLPSALFSERSSLGASWVFSFQPVLPPDCRPLVPFLRMEVGQAIDAVTGTRRLGFVYFLPKKTLTLCGRRHRDLSAVAQRLISFSAYPQAMQQHCQLSRRRNHRSFLPILSPTLSQFQPPALQIAVHSKRTQNMMRSLHQQRPQIRIPFLADVHLRLALPRVSPPRLQSDIAAHVAALAKPMRIFQREQERQRDQRPHALHLFQPRHLRITFLGDLRDLLVVLVNPFTQRLDRSQ